MQRRGADMLSLHPFQVLGTLFERTVLACDWEARDDELVFTVEANAFLRNMVRVLVGTMMQVGRGAMTVTQFAALLEGAPRDSAGPTALPHPLTLVDVRYPEEGDDVLCLRSRGSEGTTSRAD